MSSLNKAMIIGRVGRDPEVRHLPSGQAVCNFSVATGEKWRDKATGEMQEATEWHRVTAFERLAEIVGEYVRKGSLVYIEGKIQTRKYTDQSGAEKTSTEIRASDMKMLSRRDDEGGQQQEAPQQRPAQSRGQVYQANPPRQAAAARPSGGSGFDDMSDDIPFASPHAGHDPLFGSRKAGRAQVGRRG